MVDAASAIYVIGGSGADYYNDVWKSTDGGARPDSRRGWSKVLGGYCRGTWGTWVYLGLSRGTRGVT